MPKCSDFLLYLSFSFAFEQICTFCWLPEDGSLISDKQVTSNNIVGGVAGLWGGSVVSFCILKAKSNFTL